MARCTCGLHEPVLRACAGCAVAAVLPVEKGEGEFLCSIPFCCHGYDYSHVVQVANTTSCSFAGSLQSRGSPAWWDLLVAAPTQPCQRTHKRTNKTHPAYQRTMQAHGPRSPAQVSGTLTPHRRRPPQPHPVPSVLLLAGRTPSRWCTHTVPVPLPRTTRHPGIASSTVRVVWLVSRD